MTTTTILDTFKASPELVAITLRREIAGTFWDVALTCDYYGRRNPPGVAHTEYFWEARRCDWESHNRDVDGYDFKGDSAWTNPETALADAFEQLPALLAEREEEYERRMASKRWLAADPDGEGEGAF